MSHVVKDKLIDVYILDAVTVTCVQYILGVVKVAMIV